MKTYEINNCSENFPCYFKYCKEDQRVLTIWRFLHCHLTVEHLLGHLKTEKSILWHHNTFKKHFLIIVWIPADDSCVVRNLHNRVFFCVRECSYRCTALNGVGLAHSPGGLRCWVEAVAAHPNCLGSVCVKVQYPAAACGAVSWGRLCWMLGCNLQRAFTCRCWKSKSLVWLCRLPLKMQRRSATPQRSECMVGFLIDLEQVWVFIQRSHRDKHTDFLKEKAGNCDLPAMRWLVRPRAKDVHWFLFVC